MKIAFTICSANYLPFAKSLADSLVKHNPDYRFIIFLADRFSSYDAAFFSPHQIVAVPQLAFPHFEELNNRYTIFELSCALKPSAARYLIDTYKDGEAIFYFDADILLYGPLTNAETILQNHPLVLTPHLTCPAPFDTVITTELNILRTGIYNAGFFGINNSAASIRFLEWWEERLRFHCFDDAANGLFVDQLWLNLGALYFRNSVVLYHPGYNLAYWNFSERKLKTDDRKLIVNDNYPLVFFHYSGYDIHRPEKLSRHQKQYSFKDVPEYLPLFEQYREAAFKNNKEDFFSLPVTLGLPMPPPEEEKPPREKNFFKRKYKKLLKKR